MKTAIRDNSHKDDVFSAGRQGFCLLYKVTQQLTTTQTQEILTSLLKKASVGKILFSC